MLTTRPPYSTRALEEGPSAVAGVEPLEATIGSTASSPIVGVTSEKDETA